MKKLIMVIIGAFILLGFTFTIFLNNLFSTGTNVETEIVAIDEIDEEVKEVIEKLNIIGGQQLFDGFKMSDIQVLFIDNENEELFMWNDFTKENQISKVNYQDISKSYLNASLFSMNINDKKTLLVDIDASYDDLFSQTVYYGFRLCSTNAYVPFEQYDDFFVSLEEDSLVRYYRHEMINSLRLALETKDDTYLSNYKYFVGELKFITGETEANTIFQYDLYDGVAKYVEALGHYYLTTGEDKTDFIVNYLSSDEYIITKDKEYQLIGALSLLALEEFDIYYDLEENYNINDYLLRDRPIKSSDENIQLKADIDDYYKTLISEANNYFNSFDQDSEPDFDLRNLTRISNKDVIKITNEYYVLKDVTVLIDGKEQYYPFLVQKIGYNTIYYYQ